MTLLDLMAKPYPHSPGFKRSGTSQEAAEAIKPRRNQLQRLVLDALARHGPMTTDETADKLGIDRLSIRPRFSELSATGQIVGTGERRRNASSRPAMVWSLPPVALAA